jgi:hypothetical protein
MLRCLGGDTTTQASLSSPLLFIVRQLPVPVNGVVDSPTSMQWNAAKETAAWPTSFIANPEGCAKRSIRQMGRCPHACSLLLAEQLMCVPHSAASRRNVVVPERLKGHPISEVMAVINSQHSLLASTPDEAHCPRKIDVVPRLVAKTPHGQVASSSRRDHQRNRP